MHWTRPERAYCSHAAEPTRWPPRLWPALQNLTTRSPPRSIAPNHPGTLQRRRQGVFGGTPASAAAPATGSAAQTPPARHLAPGAVPSRPLALAVIHSHATLPYKLQRGGSPESLSTTAAELPCCAYKRSPELISARRQSQATSRGPPLAANRPGEASFLISGNRGCRHCPGHSGTTRASPSPFSSPETSSSSHEPIPLLNFDRGPP